MIIKGSGQSWDRAGLLLSAGCGVHCLATGLLPVLVGSTAVESCCHHSCQGEWSFHQVALGFAMLIAVMVGSSCYRSSCRGNLLKLIAGLVLMGTPHLFPQVAAGETAFTVVGVALVGWAHWTNLRNRRSDCCSHDA